LFGEGEERKAEKKRVLKREGGRLSGKVAEKKKQPACTTSEGGEVLN